MTQVDSRAEISWCMRIPHTTSEQIARAINTVAKFPKPFEVKGTFFAGENTNKYWEGTAIRHSKYQFLPDAPIRVDRLHLWDNRGFGRQEKTDYYAITVNPEEVTLGQMLQARELVEENYRRSFGQRVMETLAALLPARENSRAV